MRFLSGAYWDCGKRLQNQDSLMIQQIVTRKGRVCLAVVCDGIGGLAEGEVASGYVIERMTANFYRQLVRLIEKGKRRKTIRNSIQRCLYSINAELSRYAKGKGILLGTTMSLLLLWEHQYLICHIGDSRIYRCRNREPELLTTDHRGGRNRLLKCIGSFPFQQPDFQYGYVWRTQGFLLCTDGFSNRKQWNEQLFSPREIKEEEQIERRLAQSAGAVKRCGETDNLSAIYIKVY